MKKLLLQMCHYRVDVGILAALLTAMPFALLEGQMHIKWILASVAMGMVSAWAYLHGRTVLPQDPAALKRMRVIMLALVLVPLLWLWSMPGVLAAYVIFGVLPGFLYAGIKVGGHEIDLKKCLFAKNMVTALAWTGCAVAPFYFLITNEIETVVKVQLVSIFVLVLLIEVFWDIRDTVSDRANGARTLPAIMGVEAAKTFSVVLLAAYMCWFYVNFNVSVELMLTHGLTVMLLSSASPERAAWFYNAMTGIWIAFCAYKIFVVAPGLI